MAAAGMALGLAAAMAEMGGWVVAMGMAVAGLAGGVAVRARETEVGGVAEVADVVVAVAVVAVVTVVAARMAVSLPLEATLPKRSRCGKCGNSLRTTGEQGQNKGGPTPTCPLGGWKH